MSDIFRIVAPAEFVQYTSSQLAALAHKAEDTGDDLLLLEVEDEVERRVRKWGQIWRQEYMLAYIDQHHQQMRGKT